MYDQTERPSLRLWVSYCFETYKQMIVQTRYDDEQKYEDLKNSQSLQAKELI